MTRLDKGIFVFLLLASLVSIFLSGILFPRERGLYAVVELNGNLYGRYSLQEKEVQTLAIQSEFGYNNIVIENGKVSVTESDCSDQLEIKAGTIFRSGEMLVCLPNRLVIRIEGGKEVDGLVY